jgi:GDPmannose 4,6-dehydratase
MELIEVKSALITGITGQDGSYLAELLLGKGYQVHGLVRRASMFNRSRIEHLRTSDRNHEGQLFLHYADLYDATSMRRLVKEVNPNEVYHFAGQSHVGLSYEIPEATCQEVGMATLSLLEILRDHSKSTRLYYAASSEIFGNPSHSPQNEETPYRPVSPYGCAKAFAAQLCRTYRTAYGMFVSTGIAFNHESPRRGENFVTRKITLAAARIKLGAQDEVHLGDLGLRRDWGYAPEYVEGMWRMLQAERPDDYILATNETHSIEEFLDAAFGHVGLDWHDHVKFDQRFVRPAEVNLLCGDYAKAKRCLGWEPATRMKALAELMTDADLKALSPSASGVT